MCLVGHYYRVYTRLIIISFFQLMIPPASPILGRFLHHSVQSIFAHANYDLLFQSNSYALSDPRRTSLHPDRFYLRISRIWHLSNYYLQADYRIQL